MQESRRISAAHSAAVTSINLARCMFWGGFPGKSVCKRVGQIPYGHFPYTLSAESPRSNSWAHCGWSFRIMAKSNLSPVCHCCWHCQRQQFAIKPFVGASWAPTHTHTHKHTRTHVKILDPGNVTRLINMTCTRSGLILTSALRRMTYAQQGGPY